MPIDKTELSTEIEKGGDIATAAVEALQKKGFSIYDKAKHDEFVGNLKKDIIEKELPKERDKAIAELHNRYDTDIESALGVKKENNEKSYDYLKRAASSKLSELNSKIESYEKTIREKGDPQGILQKKIEAAEEKARLAIEERDKKIDTLSKENSVAMKNILLTNSFAAISNQFVKQLPAMFDRTKKMILDDILQTSVLKDGKLYAGDGSGGIKKDATFKEIPIDEVLKLEFKDVIDVARKQNGSGSGKGEGKDSDIDPSMYTLENFTMPADVKTQGDVVEALLKAGVPKSSDIYKKLYQKYALGQETVVENGKNVIKRTGKPLPM